MLSIQGLLQNLWGVIWNTVFHLPVSERNKIKTVFWEVGECDDCRSGESLLRRLRRAWFLICKLGTGTRLWCLVWVWVGFFWQGNGKTEESCQCKGLILFLHCDFFTWVKWCRKHKWHREEDQKLGGSSAIREPFYWVMGGVITQMLLK